MEPRWQKIAAYVILSLEKSIAQVQSNILSLEMAQAMLPMDEPKEPFPDESKGEYANRVREYKIRSAQVPRQLEMQRENLRQIMLKYEDACHGDSIVGKLAGAIDDIEKLFSVKREVAEDGDSE